MDHSILKIYTGSNTDLSINFIPKMNCNVLLDGYKTIIRKIYSVKPYYKRIRQLLLNYRKIHARQKKIEFSYLIAFIKSIIIIGIVNKGRGEYWIFLIWTLLRCPVLLIDAITFAIYGYHYRTVYGLKNKYQY
ncbi:MAG: DUF4070 domain-containing protein [Bacteroidales bacterium]|nr:MAG: DUF4070 domain-containing protein [Bacteroidales bacterium]